MSIKRWWNTPHTPFATPEFRLLLWGVFVQPVRWIRKDCMKAVVLLFLQPIKTIGVEKLSAANPLRWLPCFSVDQGTHNPLLAVAAHTVNTQTLTHEVVRSI